MRRCLMVSLFFMLLTVLDANEARALCGDVNGDGQRSATDALGVLRAAVGQPVDLVCTGEGPSRLRYYNDFVCSVGSSVSEATFNGFTFSADGGQATDYQMVDREQISAIEIGVCGTDFFFPGPINLPPDRSLTFFIGLLDPAVYEIPGVDTPAMFVVGDDGAPASAFSIAAPMTVESTVDVLYGGARSRPHR